MVAVLLTEPRTPPGIADWNSAVSLCRPSPWSVIAEIVQECVDPRPDSPIR
jgi:hypothetical protein